MLLLLALVACVAMACLLAGALLFMKTKSRPGTIQNPVLDYMPDPHVVRDGDTYYVYGTRPLNGIEVLSSTDLQHWTSLGLALPADPGLVMGDNLLGVVGGPNVWQRADGAWIMGYSGHGIPGVKWGELMVAVSTTGPAGPFAYQGLVRGVKSNQNENDGIDFNWFRDPVTGREYMFYLSWGGIYVGDFDSAKFEVSNTRLVISEVLEAETFAPPQTVDWINEAPFCQYNAADGQYYVTYSAIPTGPLYSVCLATASSPLGPYKKSPRNPLVWGTRTPGCEFDGTGSASFVRTPEGQLLCCMHVGVPSYKLSEPETRKMCITKARLDETGLHIDPPNSTPYRL